MRYFVNPKKIFFVCSVFLFLSSFFYAQEFENSDEQMNLTLEQCLNLARENNVTIKVQKNTLDDLKKKKNTSWNSVSPSISASGDFSDDFEKNTKSFSLGGGLKLSLSTNLYSSIKGASLNYENGVLTYDQAVKQIEVNVWKSFYELIYASEYYSFLKQNLETAKKTYEQNQEKFKNGKISELDVMSSRVNYEQKKPTVESSYIDLVNAYQLFKQTLGIPQNTKINLEGSLDSYLNLKEIKLPKAEKPAPSVQDAQFAVDIAKNDVLAQRFSAYGPSVTASYNYKKSQSDLSSSDWNTTNNLSVAVSIPLDGYLPWSTSSVSINSKKKDLNSKELKLKDTETSVKVKTDNYIREIEQRISSIDVLKQNVDLAKKTFEMSQTAYNYGKTDLLSLVTLSDNVKDAEISLKKEAKTLEETILDLEYLLGIDLGTILNLSINE